MHASITFVFCQPYRKKKTMKLSRALSDLVQYTRSVGLYDIEAQSEQFSFLNTFFYLYSFKQLSIVNVMLAAYLGQYNINVIKHFSILTAH